MRKFIISFLLSAISLAAISQINNLNVSGTVTDEVTGELLAERTVVISIHLDSLNRDFSYFNTVITNANGFYEDNIEFPFDENGEVFVGTLSCEGMQFESEEYSQNNNVLVIDFEVCVDSINGDDCEAWFGYHQSDAPLAIAFNDCSAGNPISWAWNFGDGENSTEQNPLHQFTTAGEYLVSLEIVANNGDCSSIIERSVYVVNDTIQNEDCAAMYYYYQDSLDSFTVNFVDMSTGINGFAPNSWSWGFGDGTTSDLQNPTHTFTGGQNEYSVCLFITSVDSVTGESCENAICTVIYLEGNNYDCEAYYFYYPVGDSNSGNSNLFHFVDNSFGNPESWLWEFGDGTTSNEENPFHEFIEEGFYEVCLSILSDSCESNYCEIVYVMNDTIDDCNTWFEYEIADQTVDFTAYFEGGDSSATYIWEFGDGETATGVEVEHTYATEGNYAVVLTAEANNGQCVSTFMNMIWIGEGLTFPVSGYVFLTDSIRADYANVYLSTFDTLGNALVNVATTQLDDEGHYVFEEVVLENCIYFVQAELTEASAYFGDYIPTYHLSAANWFEAWPVIPFFNLPNNCVWMIADSNVVAGNGNISGIVNSGGGRSLMSNVEILLMDENGNPITYLRTDENGEFVFPDLPYGTYLVHTEIVGINTITAVINISEENPSQNIVVEVANGEATLGVNNVSAYIEEVGNITPNPVAESATIEISAREESKVTIQLVNQYGQFINTTESILNTGKNAVSLQTSSLSQGVYIINIIAEDGVKTSRKLVKLR